METFFDETGGAAAPQGPAVYTLSALTSMVGQAVASHPVLRGAWVVAELSDVRGSGGHIYMELIEKDSRGMTVAKMRATIWAGTAQRLRRKFMAATGRDLTSGIKVMLFGAVNHHNLYGMSFNIGELDPSYTLGDMERLRREILEQLQREGVLRFQKQIPIPVAPQKIAVISAEGAAGYGDFINHLSSSPEGFCFYPALFPAVMQGERTSSSVCAALDRIELAPDFWDAVVIIRGGGATSDLNGFDNLELARRVALCPIPVIVGIGHERDRTVLDDIAAIRCKTPTAVANYLIDASRDALARAEDLARRIALFSSERLEGDRRRLESYAGVLEPLLHSILSSAGHRLSELASAIPVSLSASTSREHSRLTAIEANLRHASRNRLDDAGRRLDQMTEYLQQATADRLTDAKKGLDHLEQMISVLSPANTLKRGFSITRLNGKAVTDSSTLKPGDHIETTLLGGTVASEVI